MQTFLSVTTNGICDKGCLKQGIRCLNSMHIFCFDSCGRPGTWQKHLNWWILNIGLVYIGPNKWHTKSEVVLHSRMDSVHFVLAKFRFYVPFSSKLIWIFAELSQIIDPSFEGWSFHWGWCTNYYFRLVVNGCWNMCYCYFFYIQSHPLIWTTQDAGSISIWWAIQIMWYETPNPIFEKKLKSTQQCGQ